MPVYADVCTGCGRIINPAERRTSRCNRCGGTSFIQYDLGDEANRARREAIEETWRAQQPEKESSGSLAKSLLLCALLGGMAAVLSRLTTGLVWGGAMVLAGIFAGFVLGGAKAPWGRLVLGIFVLVAAYIASYLVILGPS